MYIILRAVVLLSRIIMVCVYCLYHEYYLFEMDRLLARLAYITFLQDEILCLASGDINIHITVYKTGVAVKVYVPVQWYLLARDIGAHLFSRVELYIISWNETNMSIFAACSALWEFIASVWP